MELQPTHKYDDIIDYEYRGSSRRAHMSMVDRAAQFSPFSALVGYEAVIDETGRLTDSQRELTQSSKDSINEKLYILCENERAQPMVRIIYFEPDRRKTGGSMVTINARIKRVDGYEQTLVLTDGRQIPMEAIYQLQSELFEE